MSTVAGSGAEDLAQAAATACAELVGSPEVRGRLVALLAAPDGDLAAAEDALADAGERALRHWARHGVPASPEGWLYAVARNRRRDQWRSAAHRTSVPLEPDRDEPSVEAVDARLGDLPDRRLGLLAACAHPDLDPATRTLLMLSVVLGLTARDIAAAMALPTATVAARITRAKRKVAAGGVPFALPGSAELPERVEAIREAVYGAFATDWAHAGARPREGTVGEAIYLAELLASLTAGDAESHGLAAVVCLSAARFPARRTVCGDLVPLAEQDPARWDAGLVARGEGHLRAANRAGRIGRFALEGAIQAVHMAAVRSGESKHETLHTLHQHLHRIAPSLGSTVALAAVVAEVSDPAEALSQLDRLGARADGFQPAWVLRAELLSRAGVAGDAVRAWERAISLTTEPAERRHLEARRAAAATS